MRSGPNEAALSEARRLKQLFGVGAEHAIERRVASAINSANVDQAMFLLDVQTALYGLPVSCAAFVPVAALKSDDSADGGLLPRGGEASLGADAIG